MILRFLAAYYLLFLSRFSPSSAFGLRNTKNDVIPYPVTCDFNTSDPVCHIDGTKSHILTSDNEEFDSHYAKSILDTLHKNDLDLLSVLLSLKKNKQLLSFAFINAINIRNEKITNMLVHRTLTTSDALSFFLEFARQASTKDFYFIYKIIDLCETKSFIPKQIFILAEAGMNGHIGIVQDLANLPLNVFTSLPIDLLIEAIDLKEDILDSFIDSTARLIGIPEHTLGSLRVFAYQGHINILKDKLVNSTAINEKIVSSRDSLKINLFHQLELLSAIHFRHDCEQKNNFSKKIV